MRIVTVDAVELRSGDEILVDPIDETSVWVVASISKPETGETVALRLWRPDRGVATAVLAKTRPVRVVRNTETEE